jgi:hypothetical protein
LRIGEGRDLLGREGLGLGGGQGRHGGGREGLQVIEVGGFPYEL